MVARLMFSRFSFSYDALVPAFEYLENKGYIEYLVVYEHEADESVSRTHCHCYYALTATEDTVRNAVKRAVGEVARTDWQIVPRKYLKDHGEINDRCITYASKGKLQPKRVFQYDVSRIEELRQKWENRTLRPPEQINSPADNAKAGKPTEFEMCQEIVRWYDEQLHKHHVVHDEDLIERIGITMNKYKLAKSIYKARDWFDTVIRLAQPIRFTSAVLSLVRKSYV